MEVWWVGNWQSLVQKALTTDRTLDCGSEPLAKPERKVQANQGVVPETFEGGRRIQCWEMAVEMVVVSAAELDRRYCFGFLTWFLSHLICWVRYSLGRIEDSTRTVELVV